MKPQGFTYVSRVTGDRAALESLLRSQGNSLLSGSLMAFDGIPLLHCLSMFIVEGVNGGAPLLVLEATYDGAAVDFQDELPRSEPKLIDAIYAHCEEYPGNAATQPGNVAAYFADRLRTNQLYYAGCPSHTGKRIDVERELANEVLARMADMPHGRRADFIRMAWAQLPPNVREHVRDAPRLDTRSPRSELQNLAAWAARKLWYGVVALGLLALAVVALAWFGAPLPRSLAPPAHVFSLVATLLEWFAVVAVVLGLIACAARFALQPRGAIRAFKRKQRREAIVRTLFSTGRVLPALFAAVGVIVLYAWHWSAFVFALKWLVFAVVVTTVLVLLASWWLAIKERREPIHPLEWDAERETKMRRREDLGPLNHFIGVTTLKAGLLRFVTLRVVLWGIGFLARFVDERRGLSSIRSIHFARWTLLPKDPGTKQRRLLFVAHYDGSWAGYLGDFVMNAPRGVTAIWGNTTGCPRHGFLFSDGVRDEQRFKCYARSSQVESLFWYTRRRGDTVGAIQRAAHIRNWLAEIVPGIRNEPETVSEAHVESLLRLF